MYLAANPYLRDPQNRSVMFSSKEQRKKGRKIQIIQKKFEKDFLTLFSKTADAQPKVTLLLVLVESAIFDWPTNKLIKLLK